MSTVKQLCVRYLLHNVLHNVPDMFPWSKLIPARKQAIASPSPAATDSEKILEETESQDSIQFDLDSLNLDFWTQYNPSSSDTPDYLTETYSKAAGLVQKLYQQAISAETFIKDVSALNQQTLLNAGVHKPVPHDHDLNIRPQFFLAIADHLQACRHQLRSATTEEERLLARSKLEELATYTDSLHKLSGTPDWRFELSSLDDMVTPHPKKKVTVSAKQKLADAKKVADANAKYAADTTKLKPKSKNKVAFEDSDDEEQSARPAKAKGQTSARKPNAKVGDGPAKKKVKPKEPVKQAKAKVPTEKISRSGKTRSSAVTISDDDLAESSKKKKKKEKEKETVDDDLTESSKKKKKNEEKVKEAVVSDDDLAESSKKKKKKKEKVKEAVVSDDDLAETSDISDDQSSKKKHKRGNLDKSLYIRKQEGDLIDFGDDEIQSPSEGRQGEDSEKTKKKKKKTTTKSDVEQVTELSSDGDEVLKKGRKSPRKKKYVEELPTDEEVVSGDDLRIKKRSPSAKIPPKTPQQSRTKSTATPGPPSAAVVSRYFKSPDKKAVVGFDEKNWALNFSTPWNHYQPIAKARRAAMTGSNNVRENGVVTGWVPRGAGCSVCVRYEYENFAIGRLEPGRYHDFVKDKASNIKYRLDTVLGNLHRDADTYQRIPQRRNFEVVTHGLVYFREQEGYESNPAEVLTPISNKSGHGYPEWPEVYMELVLRVRGGKGVCLVLVNRNRLPDFLKMSEYSVQKVLYEKANRDEKKYTKAQIKNNITPRALPLRPNKFLMAKRDNRVIELSDEDEAEESGTSQSDNDDGDVDEEGSDGSYWERVEEQGGGEEDDGGGEVDEDEADEDEADEDEADGDEADEDEADEDEADEDEADEDEADGDEAEEDEAEEDEADEAEEDEADEDEDEEEDEPQRDTNDIAKRAKGQGKGKAKTQKARLTEEPSHPKLRVKLRGSGQQKSSGKGRNGTI